MSVKIEPVDPWLDARLAKRHLLTLPEVAEAIDISEEVVTAWLESGEIEGVEVGGGKKAYWRIVRSSVLAFWTRRKLGRREAATPTLKRQCELFATGTKKQQRENK